MNMYAEFGSYLKHLRLDAGLNLRAFSEKAEYDISNMSKVERGLLPPPPGNLTLRKWAAILNLDQGSREYGYLMDLAATCRTEKPDGIREKEVAEYLPAFYRTLRNRRLDEQTYNKLIELLKKS